MGKPDFTTTELYLIHEIVIRLDRIARSEILDPLGISYPEFLVMMAVRELDRPTQDAAGSHVDLSSSLVSQRVSALRKKGLIMQTRNQENRRKVFLNLTEKGNRVLDSAYETMVTGTEEIFGLTDPNRSVFTQGLLTIALALRAHENEQ